MVRVGEAEKIILAHRFSLSTETVELAAARHRILAETVVSDRDLPPFDRATMDGIAISYAEYAAGSRDFIISGTQAAGQPRQTLNGPGQAIEIMTGAPVPIGADCVVPYEDITLSGKQASVAASVVKNQSVHAQGSDAPKGQVLLTPGLQLTAADIAVLASAGQATVLVYRTPSAAVISTGDELVDITETPLAHQIRRSNSHALAAALADLGCQADLFHLPDEPAALAENLQLILNKYELIILSGGVSKGKFDFVPKVLEAAGVKKLFHQVSQRPGKPMWFGHSHTNTVFALPGNPVSTFMCFYRYIKPWLLTNLHHPIKSDSAILATDFSFPFPLTYFLQVKIVMEAGRRMAYPLAGGGSGDFVNLTGVDGFLELPQEISEFKQGQAFPFIAFR